MISVRGLSIFAGAFRLEGASFDVPAGAYAVLMGRTGTGKTSILEAIAGLRPIAAGVIRLGERDVTALRPAARGVAYVPQDRALFGTMTVREHLAFALVIRKVAEAAIEARVAELAEWLRLGELLERRPAGLSGGEAQRVALGRALSYRPDILLLDEPLSALDDETRAEMHGVLRAVREHTGVTTLHVTHNVEDARQLADRLLVLEGGRVQDRTATLASGNGAAGRAYPRGPEDRV